MQSILILCCGHPYVRDESFGAHVAKALWAMDLPENVECIEVGYSASEFPHEIDGKDKLIVVDIIKTNDPPGTLYRLRPEEVPLTTDGATDVPKMHLMEVLEELRASGKCPETEFILVVPKDISGLGEELTPELEEKVPVVVKMIQEVIEAAK